MTPTEIAAMQADREAGTKGPWDVHPNCDGHMGRLDVVGPTLTCRGFTIATNVDARKAARINSDANRIARVPDMEAQIIADAAYIAELEAIIDLADKALSEAEAILGGEYGDQYGPLCEIMVTIQRKISDRRAAHRRIGLCRHNHGLHLPRRSGVQAADCRTDEAPRGRGKGERMMRTKSIFTFGQSHMTNFPLPNGGRIADYWVTVDLPESMAGEHRDVFIREFTEQHCPRPNQFAMEYDEGRFEPSYFPGGELCLITENGIQR